MGRSRDTPYVDPQSSASPPPATITLPPCPYIKTLPHALTGWRVGVIHLHLPYSQASGSLPFGYASSELAFMWFDKFPLTTQSELLIMRPCKSNRGVSHHVYPRLPSRLHKGAGRKPR